MKQGNTVMDRELLVNYLFMKAREEDWHGVSNAANDLREVDAVSSSIPPVPLESTETWNKAIASAVEAITTYDGIPLMTSPDHALFQLFFALRARVLALKKDNPFESKDALPR